MIIDSIKNAPTYSGLDSKFQKAFEFLAKTDLNSLETGKYFIQEPDVFALVQEYETKKTGTADLEAHRKYIDLQYVVWGTELMGYAKLSSTSEKTEYDEIRDMIFLNGSADFIKAEAGTFAIFYPHDAHMPSMADGETSKVKKIVIKIAV